MQVRKRGAHASAYAMNAWVTVAARDGGTGESRGRYADALAHGSQSSP